MLTLMRRAAIALALAALLFTASAPVLRAQNKVNDQVDVIHTSAGDLKVRPLYHGSVMLEFAGKVIHVDPWSMGDYTGLPPADLIVITHTHADHLDRTMVDKLHKPGTLQVADDGRDRGVAEPRALGDFDARQLPLAEQHAQQQAAVLSAHRCAGGGGLSARIEGGVRATSSRTRVGPGPRSWRPPRTGSIS